MEAEFKIYLRLESYNFCCSLPRTGELADDEESAVERYYRPTFVQKPPPDNHTEEGKLVRFDVKVLQQAYSNFLFLLKAYN